MRDWGGLMRGRLAENMSPGRHGPKSPEASGGVRDAGVGGRVKAPLDTEGRSQLERPVPMGRSRVGSVFLVPILIVGFLALPQASGHAQGACRAANVTQGKPGRSDLQAVIDAAAAGDTIVIKGVCSGHFRMNEDLVLTGRPTRTVPKPVIRTDTIGRVLTVHRADATLTNLKIAGGRETFGGGIFVWHGTLRLNDSLVTGNSALYYGGGIASGHGRISLNDSIVRGNRATEGGGGIRNLLGPLVLNGTSSVRANSTRGEGGGIAAYGTLILNDSASVTDNEASWGGGISSWGTTTLNDSSSVRRNRASENGGGIESNWDVLLNDSSAVRGNTAASSGGGIRHETGSLTMTGSSSVAGNTAKWAGGLDAKSPLTLRDSSSITGNTASEKRGGLRGQFVYACDGTGGSEWTGAISPNNPDDPPTVTWITCTQGEKHLGATGLRASAWV